MKTWILPVGAAALATLLAVAALSPDATREMLSVPIGWIEARRTASLQARARAEWADIERRAHTGDPDAMHVLGTKMLFWSNEEWTGVPTDSAEGRKLIRSAADRGHVDAMLELWRIENGSPDELLRIAATALTAGTEFGHSYNLSDRLRWEAVQECDAAVRNAANRNFESTADVSTEAERARHRAFLDTFERRCPAH